MAEPDQADISVDEIMRRIKVEIERRRASSAASKPDPGPQSLRTGGSGLEEKRDSTQVEIIPLDKLDPYMDSRWFVAAGGRGIKGWVKGQIFKLIRFYTWWQEHINRSLYEEINRHQTKIREIERDLQETFRQKIQELVAELSTRDQALDEINQRLIHQTKTQEQQRQDLERLEENWEKSQEALRQTITETTEARQSLLRDEWSRKLEALTGEGKGRDRILEELKVRLTALRQQEEVHYQENLRKGSAAEEREQTFRKRIESAAGELRGQLTAQHRGLEEIQQWLTNHTAEEENFRNQIGQTLHSAAQKVQRDLAIRDQALGELKIQAAALLQSAENLKAEITAREAALGNAVTREIEALRQSLTAREHDLQGKKTRLESLSGLKGSLEKENQERALAFEELKGEIQAISRQVLGHKQSITEQHRRLSVLLEEARKRLPQKLSRAQLQKMAEEKDHLLDSFYVSFEDQFRGTREEIKERLKVYLPHVRQDGLVTKESPVLDLGCGRGEWLELLREEGVPAEGVDLNRVMVSICRDLSLEAAEGDALEYLRKLKANSLGAVTGFQFVEHVSLGTLVAILDECLRVLKSRGLIIFETPNPENLFVGAYSFHIDPTHKAPLIPDSFNFLAQQRGFVETKILRLNKYSDFHPAEEKVDEFRKKWFYSETDFALIGYKP